MAKAPGMIVRWLLPPAILAAAVWGFVTLKNSRPEKPPLVTEEKVWPVTVQRVHKASYRPQIALYGQVQSPLSHRLVSAVTAKVLRVMVKAGEYQPQGALLVALDDHKLEWIKQQRQADLKEIRALLESEKTRHAHDLKMLQSEQALLTFSQQQATRVSTLADNNLGTQAAVDEAQQLVIKQRMAMQQRRYSLNDYPHRRAKLQARKARAKVALLQAQDDITFSQITMPYNGWVNAVSVYPGDEIRAGTLLAVVYRPDELEVSAQIPQRYVATIRQSLARGEALSAAFSPALATAPWVLDRLAAQVGEDGGIQAFFRATSLADAVSLVTGERHTLILQLPAVANTVAIPQSAMYGNQHVYRVHNQRLQRLAVHQSGLLLSATDHTSRVLIHSPSLNNQDALLITQLPAATDGLAVQVLND